MSRPIRGMMWRRTNGRGNMMFELFRVYTTNARATTVPLAVGFCHFEMASHGRAVPFFSFDSFSPPLLLSTGRRSNDDTNISYWWLYGVTCFIFRTAWLCKGSLETDAERKRFSMLTWRIERERKSVAHGRRRSFRLQPLESKMTATPL